MPASKAWVSKLFYDKGPQWSLWAGLQAARGKITKIGIHNGLNVVKFLRYIYIYIYIYIYTHTHTLQTWSWAAYYILAGRGLETKDLKVMNMTVYWPIGQCSHKHIDTYIFYAPLQRKLYHSTGCMYVQILCITFL
jgi:hypothetical protein